MIFTNRVRVAIARRVPPRDSLRERLVAEGRTSWIDVGCGVPAPGFIAADLHTSTYLKESDADRFIEVNLLEPGDTFAEHMEKFDFVRASHVFEHFTFEEGQKVLKTIRALLKPDGILAMTVPDLKIEVRAYLSRYRWSRFLRMSYAKIRLPDDAPPSYIFSHFAHQNGWSPIDKGGDAHKWCYDEEGLAYQFEQAGGWRDVRPLKLLQPGAEIGFTHLHPHNDLCMLATRDG